MYQAAHEADKGIIAFIHGRRTEAHRSGIKHGKIKK